MKKHAFLAMFGALAMFFNATVLPGLILVTLHYNVHSVSWIIRFALVWLGLSWLPAIFFAWVMFSVANAAGNKSRRAALWHLARTGERLMLFTNPIGLVLFLCFLYWKHVLGPLVLSVVDLGLPSPDEGNGSSS